MNIQFKKGVLEMCVLVMLESGDRYGYDIANELSQSIAISNGTVYPILRRLKQEEYVSSYLVESPGGAPRKYYAITPQGKRLADSLKTEWLSFSEKVTAMIQLLQKEGEAPGIGDNRFHHTIKEPNQAAERQQGKKDQRQSQHSEAEVEGGERE